MTRIWRSGMIKDFLIGKTAIPKLSKGLDVYALRQKIISGNIANVQTPGYRRREVKFEEHLQHAVSGKLAGIRTDPHHLSIGKKSASEVQPRIVEDASPQLKSGVNNVDIDVEMVDQVKNEIRFLYGSRLLNKSFAALRASIKGRFDQ